MNILLLYLATIVIWGSTWIGIKFQLGQVAAEVSILYRFLLAATTLLIFAKLKGFSLCFSLKEHLRMFFLGLFLFSMNYLFFYKATYFLTTGLIAVIFSAAPILNILNEFLILHKKPKLFIMLGAFCGLMGVMVLFLPEISNLNLHRKALQGVLLALGGTFSFSFGNLVSHANQKSGLKIIPSTAYSMLYGCLLVFLFILYHQTAFALETSFLYLGSLFYLAIPGSAIAFICYLSLIGKIGSARSAYVTVLFPVIALMLSTVFEDFVWSSSTLIGFLLIILGNMIILSPKKSKKIDFNHYESSL